MIEKGIIGIASPKKCASSYISPAKLRFVLILYEDSRDLADDVQGALLATTSSRGASTS